MPAKLEVGRTYRNQTRVEEWMTAEKAGNRGVDVLSTPALVQLVEDAALQCMAPAIAPGDASVASHIEIAHIAPTPVGLIVRVEVEIVSVDGSHVSFAFSAFDEREKIADGTHERFVVQLARFNAGITEKTG